MKENLHEKESAFHDAWAESTAVEAISVRECFEAPTALENRFILSKMGDLRGKRLLDVGAGLGESSVYFALQGARVTSTDLSPAMVDLTVRLAEFHGVKVDGKVCPAEDLDFQENGFDIVYLANTIHHVQDRARLFETVARVLKPGGWFYSWDPIAYNPAIGIYRRMADRVRTEDEDPLRMRDLAMARRHFDRVDHREFWIAALALFAKYYLVDKIHPNKDRYWKRILRETPGTLRWWMPLHAVDKLLTRIPGVRWLAWNMAMWGQKRET